jgi:hypothetical protein
MIDWMLRGYGEGQIREALPQWFPEAVFDDLVKSAAEHFTTAGHVEGLMVRGFCIEAYRSLYQKALDIGDYTTALKALARLENAARK